MVHETARGIPALGEVWGDLVRRGAECVYDPELHAGPVGVVEMPEERVTREAVAREVCASCPVFADCEAYALLARPSSGVWAGRTAEEIEAEAEGFVALEGVA